MDLFHQTVSMKSVGDLNEFVRSTCWSRSTPRELDRTADRALRRPEPRRTRRSGAPADQLDALTPLLADCDEYDRLSDAEQPARAPSGTRCRTSWPPGSSTLTVRIDDLRTEIASRTAAVDGIRRHARRLAHRARAGSMSSAPAGAATGSPSSSELDPRRRAGPGPAARQGRPVRRAAHRGRARPGGRRGCSSRRDGARSRLRLVDDETRVADLDNRLMRSRGRAHAGSRSERTSWAQELRSLHGRRHQPAPPQPRAARSAVPRARPRRRVAAVRRRADPGPRGVRRLGGRSRAGAARLRPVAARAARASTRPCRGGSTPATSAPGWSTTGCPAVVAPQRRRRQRAGLAPRRHAGAEGRSVRDLARARAGRRAGYVCADTSSEFRRADRGITRPGQIKDRGGRHEKDDRRRIDDRRRYVLGWSNDTKIDALLADAAATAANVARADGRRSSGSTKDGASIDGRRSALGKLAEYAAGTSSTGRRSVRPIVALRPRRPRLESSSDVLERLAEMLQSVAADIDEEERELTTEHASARGRDDPAGDGGGVAPPG